MKVLIVATNVTPAGVQAEVAAGKHHRIDYIELAESLATRYVDYSLMGNSQTLRRAEETLRMDMRLAWQVKRLVQQENYDVVLSLSERVGLPLTRLLDRHVKQVVIIHHPMSPQKLNLMKLLGVAEHWNKIITISHAEEKGLEQALNLPDALVETLILPVDTAFYKPPIDDVPLEAQDHAQSLGLSHRDFPTLIRAMRQLPDITLHLRVGSTWVNHRSTHEGEDLPNNVQIQPFVHPSVLRECYTRSRFIIVPIINDTQWTAGGVSVQVAQAMGKAVIASDRPGLSSYLIDGETGILVRTGDAQDMAEAIEYLWRNPEVARKMGQRGREWLEANFSMERWLKKMTAILEEVADF